jgi:hypothetical protein
MTYPLGFNPWSVAVADCNNDGIQDLVATGILNSVMGLSVFLGRGDGSFQSARTTALATSPSQLVVGDLNGDGKADVVTGQNVLLGNGDGTFQPAQLVSLPKNQILNFLAAGDFNNDGKLDLAVGAYTQTITGGRWGRVGGSTTYYVNILLGQGDGSFRAKSSIQGVGTIIVVGDFNRDGTLDVLAPGMNLLLGNGDGTLQKPVAAAEAGGAGTTPLAVGDFNGDGKPDVLTLTFNSNGNDTLDLFLGNANSTFQAPQILAPCTNGITVSVGDFNRDGKLDVVATDAARGSVSLLLGNGDGSFQAAQNFSVRANPGSVAVADFNGDGCPDLEVGVSNYGSNPQLAVLLNDRYW